MVNNNSKNAGFTLLEVLIAMAILVVSLASILAVEGGSIEATRKAKQMNVVSMLAKNLMIETEFKIKGKKFEEIRTDESGTFEAPYEKYSWNTKVKEIKFPQIQMTAPNAGGGASNAAATNVSGQGDNQFATMLTRLVSNYLSKALREVTVTISWEDSGKKQKFYVAMYWVNLNNDFNLSE